jgi:DNA-binding PadR family transcriptional regulator
MEKRLLLLGMLRHQHMHGYQLNEMLANDVASIITLKRSNAYKLLNSMEEEGWITYHEEREGGRPPRRVYAVTAEGEAAFQRLLRESLAAYRPSEFASIVPFDFLNELPPQEARALLEERRAKIAGHFAELDGVPEEVQLAHPSFEYLHRHYAAELEWLDEVSARLGDLEKV